MGERNSDPDRREIKVRRVVWNDKQFDPYPPRRWPPWDSSLLC